MTPIRIIGGPWPERIGLTGHIVPQLRDEYPWHGMAKDEVIVFLPDDPYGNPRGDWTCCLKRKDVADACGLPGATQ